MNFSLILDNSLQERVSNLSVHKSAADLDGVREVSSNFAYPKPFIATLASWSDSDLPLEYDPEKAERMRNLLT